MSSFLIGYDITEPRRLGRIYRAMCKLALPLEYSIFLLDGSERDARNCIAAMEQLMNRDSDDVRCYPLPASGYQKRLGKAVLPEGIHWTGLPARFN